jgi:hypothetical protein
VVGAAQLISMMLGYPGRAHLNDAARQRARSTLYTVAVQDGCTNIPRSAGRAQDGETILIFGFFGQGN